MKSRRVKRSMIQQKYADNDTDSEYVTNKFLAKWKQEGKLLMKIE